MAFHPLDSIRSFFSQNNSRRYTKTRQLPEMTMLINGQPEWLDPETWNIYETYMTTPQLYAVIQRKGFLLSSGVWKHYDRNGNEIENSEVVKLLENPNPLMTGKDYIRQYSENKSLYGNNYEYLNKIQGFDLPASIMNLPPWQIEIQTTGKIYKQTDINEIIKQYKLMYGTKVNDTFEPSEINHIRIPNGQNPIKGDSPLRPLFMPISNIRSAYGFRNVIMNKKGALGMLSNSSKDDVGGMPLDKKERERLEKAYQRQYGIDDDQMQVLMTNASLNWQAMSYPTKDLMLFEEVDADFRNIIDAYGLNDNIFSKEKGSTFENLAEGLKQAYQSTIIPESEELSLNRTQLFGLQERGEFVKLDYDHIPVLQANKKEESERIERLARAAQIMSETGLISGEEIREIMGY